MRQNSSRFIRKPEPFKRARISASTDSATIWQRKIDAGPQAEKLLRGRIYYGNEIGGRQQSTDAVLAPIVKRYAIPFQRSVVDKKIKEGPLMGIVQTLAPMAFEIPWQTADEALAEPYVSLSGPAASGQP